MGELNVAVDSLVGHETIDAQMTDLTGSAMETTQQFAINEDAAADTHTAYNIHKHRWLIPFLLHEGSQFRNSACIGIVVHQNAEAGEAGRNFLKDIPFAQGAETIDMKLVFPVMAEQRPEGGDRNSNNRSVFCLTIR